MAQAKIIEQFICNDYYIGTRGDEVMSVISVYDNGAIMQKNYSKLDYEQLLRYELTEKHSFKEVYDLIKSYMPNGLKSRLEAKTIFVRTYSKEHPIPKQKLWKKPKLEDK